MPTSKVGQVAITQFKSKRNHVYSDSSESFLSVFFNKPQSKKKKEIVDILSGDPSWPILYHLSPQREALLTWYPFKKNSSLLEIGAGCGALTGLFCNRLKNVYANELTNERGEIIAKRFSDKKNLNIYIGNIQNIDLSMKFDYISIIGVLEYAGRYFKHDNRMLYEPYLNFLSIGRRFLKKGGHLILAIENKLGIKYFSGGKEDHYGDFFSSLENYPNYDGIRTFSKNELENMLKKVGFTKINFYYPFPDYKLPTSIFSGDGLKTLNVSKSSYLRVADLSNIRLELFNEVIASGELAKENIIEHFSNSFLVDAML